MNTIKIWMLVLACLVGMACNREDDLTPSEGLEPFFTLPQGDHDYDATLVEWHEKWGFYPVYVWEPKDLYWNNTGWAEGRPLADWAVTGTLLGEPANPDYVGKQVEMLEEGLFSRFPEAYFSYLPVKMLFCSELNSFRVKTFYIPPTYQAVDSTIITRQGSVSSYGLIALNGGNEEILGYSNEDKLFIVQGIAAYLGERLVEEGILVPPAAFYEEHFTDQYEAVGSNSGTALFQFGILRLAVASKTLTLEQKVSSDFSSYVAMALGNSLAKLNGPLETYDADIHRNTPPFGGAFDPSRDRNGLVKEKYEITVQYLREMNIDIDYYQAGE